MSINFKVLNNDKLLPVDIRNIEKAEKDMKIMIPRDLKEFYKQIGYGTLYSPTYNTNLIMGPLTVRDFRLRQDYFENFTDIELYDDCEDNKLIFFEANEAAFMSIEIESEGKGSNKIYYYDVVIANSLVEFLNKMREDEKYYTALFK